MKNHEFCNKSQEKKPPGLQDAKKHSCTPKFPADTGFKEARKITIELKFTQNEARDDVSCAVSVKEKLAAQAPMQTAFVVGKNLKTGEMYAEEYGRHNHLKGQMSIDEMCVDPETGEVLEEQPKANNNVIDLRMVATN